MTRIHPLAAVSFLLIAPIYGFGQSEASAESALRRIQINSRTIMSLPRGKKYVVDLTKRGVKYEFGPKVGQIDFSRVMVRTARGEVAIGSFLEKTFLKGKLAGFKYASQPFILGTRTAGTVRTPTRPTLPPTTPSQILTCGAVYCVCTGNADCFDLIDTSTLCGPAFMCGTDPKTGEDVCICVRA